MTGNQNDVETLAIKGILRASPDILARQVVDQLREQRVENVRSFAA